MGLMPELSLIGQNNSDSILLEQIVLENVPHLKLG
jgi:hypothetical protein